MELIEDHCLSEKFEKEIFEKTLDLSIDYEELSLDQFINDEILKEIPIVKTLITFYKVSSSIIARHNVKKIIVFLQQIHLRNIDSKKLDAFKQKFQSNKSFKNNTLETILVLLEKFIDIEKSKILANFFAAYIAENISWDEFRKMSFILNSLNPAAHGFLENIITKKEKVTVRQNYEGEALLLASGIGSTFEDRFRLGNIGERFYEFGIKPLKDK